ncbi:MAG: hypothetical protein ACYC6G_02140 [Desulfobaccales bacterium]
MGRREKFSSHVKCPKCGKEGTAAWEENENPVHGKLNTILESLSEGFHPGPGKDMYGYAQIICDKCNIPIK